MQACDRVTAERFGVSSVDLMRSAAASIVNVARRQFPQARGVTALCGRGNNGGDGFMAARLLAEAGLTVTVILLGSPDAIKGDAAIAWRELEAAGSCAVHAVGSAEEFQKHQDALDTDLILDAVVGTGFKPPLKGLALAVLERVNAAIAARQVPVLAVDLPSGWPADDTRGTVSDPVYPGRCGGDLHGAQARSRVRTVDPQVGSAGDRGPDRVARRSDRLRAQHALGRVRAGTDSCSRAQPMPTKANSAMCWWWGARSDQRAAKRARRR